MMNSVLPTVAEYRFSGDEALGLDLLVSKEDAHRASRVRLRPVSGMRTATSTFI